MRVADENKLPATVWSRPKAAMLWSWRLTANAAVGIVALLRRGNESPSAEPTTTTSQHQLKQNTPLPQ
jgi:hypothetical protein